MIQKQAPLKRFLVAIAAFALAACASGSAPTANGDAGPQGEAMVSAANPHAVEAALEILRDGGTAVDAAIAAELVLGLVEPQSSGIGGGGFLLFYNAENERIIGYDGRERAPAGATATMFLDPQGRPMSFIDAVASGRSTGTPSLVAMLKLAHDEHGRLPWARLFEAAIRLAESGFEVSPRLARLSAMAGQRGRLRADFAARAYFFDREGNAWPVGHLLRNPEYAATLRAIAEQGPQALTQGPIAEQIVRAVQRNPRGGTLSLADLQAYQPKRFEPVCGAYRAYRVCGAPAPSSGATVIEILGLYQRARPEPEGANNADDWAAFLWASRLAYADRDHYMADDEFAPMPTQELVAPAYLEQRAQLIDLAAAPPTLLPPGAPAGEELFNQWGRDLGDDPGTTHLSVVDAWGNAVALTATVESAFGSQRMVAGFMLNNQLTDFAFTPTLNGRPVANAIEPRKRPRSSMSPTIVTDRNGDLVLVIGSPGGSAIIGYVARATIGILDWNMTPQAAIDLGNATARTPPARLELNRLPEGVAAALTARGWQIADSSGEESGLHAIQVTESGLVGGADPRREGVVGRLPAPSAVAAPVQ
ncbi:gamma-glutamyltranspeptidase [alpha proteobacterium U9-1i]|nr:gamma-glutamyltranspeptidase [alpha proteobacterium U9-1i]